MTVPFVVPVLRLIPNGFVEKVEKETLRFTVYATPAESSAGKGFSIEQWPEKAPPIIAELLKANFKWGSAIGTDGAPVAFNKGPVSGLEFVNGDPQPRSIEIRNAWAKIASPGDWESLLQAIESSLKSETFDNNLGEAKPVDENNLNLAKDGKLQADKSGGTKSIDAVVPIKQGDLAWLLERERAERIFTDLQSGNSAPYEADGPALIRKEDSTQSDDRNKTQQKHKEQLNAAIAKKRRANFVAQIGKINEERTASSIACENEMRTDDVNEIIKRKSAALATHQVGTWPQTASAPPGDAETRANQTIARYQAIVSSPGWARIFGFAYDVTWKAGKEGESVRWITAGAPISAISDLPLPWSSVGAMGWPGEMDPASAPLLNGQFLMGRDCGKGTLLPRFDVVTLDVRQAADLEAADKLESKPGRHPYQTVGMTIIDRGRAADTRQQISRTNACKKDNVICLFAEDLVIGRRLDVGILTSDEGIVWRPLGAAEITYGWRRDDDGFGELKDAANHIPAKMKATLEQATVSAAARLVPSPVDGHPKNEVHAEVFVEEALATWTGAPMGVFTGKQVEDPKSAEAHLYKEDTDPDYLDKKRLQASPFLQRQRLPTATTLRLPPLRYGKSYRFGMRAVFLGGGSLDVDAAQENYNQDIQAFTYPIDPDATNGFQPLRRFVRHEPIGAPFVLLPLLDVTPSKSIPDAAPPSSEMDFPQARSAVLRSLPAHFTNPQSFDLPPSVNGRRYIRAKERVSAKKIIRVFVPPQISFEQLLRCSVFDEQASRKAAMDGALLSTAFGIKSPHVPYPDRTPAAPGFPVAITAEQRAFGFDGTRISQSVGWSTRSSGQQEPAQGSALFASRKAVPAHDRQPYWPDPHAHELVLRLRRRSDGTYLCPTRSVRLYALGERYPDVRPTVLEIVRSSGPVDDALRFSETEWTTFDGMVFKGKDAQKVSRVVLTLAPGEDFNLEASYIPAMDDLARKFAVTESLGAFFPDPNNLPDPAKALLVTSGNAPVPDDDNLKQIASRMIGHIKGTPEAPKSLTTKSESTKPTERKGGPIEDIAGVTVMRVAHAVNQPREVAKPLVREDQVIRAKAFQASTDKLPVPMETLLKDAKDAGHAPGSSTLLVKGDLWFDRATTSAIEVLATCASPRSPRIDDETRGRPLKARVAGTWPNRTNPKFGREAGAEDPKRIPANVLDVFGFENIDPKNGKVTLQQSEVTVLRISSISGPGTGILHLPADGAKGNDNLLNVAAAQIAAMQGIAAGAVDKPPLFTASIPHVFPDTKARLLKLRLRAVSRFATDFETAARWTGSMEVDREVVSLRQPLDVLEQSVLSNALTVWMPSSKRPDKCAVSTVLPVFRHGDPTDGPRTLTRKSAVRIYLERGWYSSGEGEQLGILLADNGVEISAAYDRDDVFGLAGPYLSRWGGDPTKKDAIGITGTLAAKNFEGGEGACISVKVPIRLPATDGAADEKSAHVLVRAGMIPFEPGFDIDREQWFVDVAIENRDTPNTMVRFGLVRYQPHSISEDIMVSEPVTAWTQLLPDRKTHWEKMQKDEKTLFTFTVEGHAHLSVHVPAKPKDSASTAAKTKTGKGVPSFDGELHRPHIVFRIMYESGDDAAKHRNVLCEETVAASIEQLHQTWTFEWTLPEAEVKQLGDGILVLYVEEIEKYMPASYPVEPVGINEIFDSKTLVASGPRFAARMELERYTDTVTGDEGK